jgi:hypothetical protein
VLYKFWLKLPVSVGTVVAFVATLTVVPFAWPCSNVFCPKPEPKENNNITAVKISIQVTIALFFVISAVIVSLLTPNILTAKRIKKIIITSKVNHGVKLCITDTTPDDNDTKNPTIIAMMAFMLFLSGPKALVTSSIEYIITKTSMKVNIELKFCNILMSTNVAILVYSFL